MASSSKLDPTSLPPSSSSSSASTPKLKWTYDVFLSFRGEDTRNNFVGHLFMNLTHKGIHTFLDDERLEQGKEISPELLKAIEESRFAIIIFSENYASSSWCLDELVKIIDCMEETGQIVYPVFYNVDPSDVRKQEGSIAEAFDEHEKKNLALEKMEKWKDALSRAGSLSGWDTRGRSEAEIIQKIVEEIFYKLSRALLHVDDNLVGMEIPMKEINTLLDTRSNDVKFVGIHGLGGIGKTTTAKVIYNQISHQFEGCSYLANIRASYEKEHNLVSLQKQLLCDILKVQDLQIGDDDSGSSIIQHMLNNQKVLVILDDVDHENQLEKLAGNGEWFGLGSRIIITTRYLHLLSKYEGVQRYEVRRCDLDKSLEIFSWKAFKQNYPPEDYMELSNEVVRYAKGLPLALTVLGSHLRGRSKDEWEGAIEELKIIPNEDVTQILKISYKGLNPIQKNVFLGIACFFNGEDKDEVMEKLDSCGFYPSINIPVLIDKSLITVSAKNELMMHDLVQYMGQHIVHQESSKNPGKRSRLWNTEDIRRVLEKNMATEAIEGIPTEAFMQDWSFKVEAFKKMKTNLKWTYDVFLSFRGEDTRNNFVDHLFMNLTQKGIKTFCHDEKLERGKEISGHLLKAIEESKFAIIIFSENYASSSWCLDELVQIIDRTKETGQIAYPVFYNVDPSNVRKQEGCFANAFDEHEKKNLALGKMNKWREALSQAGSLSGWDCWDRPEAKIIQEIVEKILHMRASLHVDDNLVGMEIHMKKINTLLDTRSDDVKFVGIHGLGGIGKTTIARVIYNQISHQFEGCSYLANIRATYEKECNLVSLQKQLFYDILKVQDLQIGDDDSGSSIIQHRLNNQKVLIILDDVDHVNQLEKLAGNGEWFGPGSIIIITTRDQHLLNKYEGVQRYEVKECDRDNSLEIFSWKAFKRNYPPEDYMELSNNVVHYTEGLPLALTVLGSHLHDRSKGAWRDAIDQLKIIPNRDIKEILKISYEGLEELQKNVFLDIACFFNGEDKDEVMEKLDSFGFYPSINIPVLIDKSLITISAKNELMMHDLVRDMGRHIVHQESPKNPGKWSRLWNTEDIRRVLENNMATEAIEGIQTEAFMHDWSFKAEAFMKLKNLRFLEWIHYRSEYPALDFLHDKLVHLSLKNSSIKSLWNGRKFLQHLKSIDLSYYYTSGICTCKVLKLLKSIDLTCSQALREFPDVIGLPNLERLSLCYCTELVKIDPSVWVHKGLKFLYLSDCYILGSFPNKIEMESLVELDISDSEHLREFPDVSGLPNLERLSLHRCSQLVKIDPSVWVHKGIKFLNLSDCYNLQNFPNKIEMESLETLNLTYCMKMEEFPEVHGNMKCLSKLVLTRTVIKELPSSIENFTALKSLDLYWCKNLKCLPSSICKLKYLATLHLRGCTNLEKLPENIGDLESLVVLDASRTAIKEVPVSIQFLDKLRKLSFANCSGLNLPSFYGLPSSLTSLDLSWCDLTDETFPSNIECLSLEELYLSGNNFVSLPTNISKLPLLTELHLTGCKRIKSIPELPPIKYKYF